MTEHLGQLQLPPEVASVTRARHYVRETLTQHHARELLDDAQLAVSELIANAVKHAGTEFVLTLDADDDALTVRVADGHPDAVEPVERGPLAESGRGLRIVEALASEWGVEQHGDGKTLWFRLPMPRRRDSAPVLQLRPHRAAVASRAALRPRSSSG